VKANPQFPNSHYVALHVGPVPNSATEQMVASIRRLELRNDIWIERLDTELAKRIMRACETADYGIERTVMDRHLYAWVRVAPDIEVTQFDGIYKLVEAIALSRLVHPTSTSFRYSAWVSDLTPNPRLIRAVPYHGINPDILLAPNSRDWLNQAEGAEMKKLMDWLVLPMCDRVRRAFWNHEYAMRLYELDLRYPMIVGAFEALTNTNVRQDTWEFVYRTGSFADQFGVSLTEDELRKAYKLRSKLVHAESFLYSLADTVPLVEQPVLYLKLEKLLQLTLKECFLNETFYDRFADANSVRQHWPLP
jgi:hypothetical protein